MYAQKDIAATGDGKLELANAGDLRLQSTRLGTSTGADQSISNTGGRVSIDLPDTETNGGAPLAEAGVGGSLAISGMQISHGGFISARAGEVTLQATGAQPEDGVTLQSGSRIDASGVNKKLGGVAQLCAAGKVSLQSENGNIDIKAAAASQSAAAIDLSGARDAANSADGSDAGTLSIKAEHGIFSLGGTLLGSAAAGKRQGSVELDVGSLGNYRDWMIRWLPSGFTQSLDARVRNGNVLIGAADVIRAHQYKLSADTIIFTVSGTVEAEGAAGGRIQLYAGNNATLTDGASLRANATANGERGGGWLFGYGGWDARSASRQPYRC